MSVDGEASAGRDGRVGPGGAYPLPLEQRMRASDFARRLKEAEALQRDEDAAKQSVEQAKRAVR